MQVRATTIKRGGKTYQYAQLVESYRRESDGTPQHRVVANLGRVTDPLQLENLKAAFAANRSGQKLAPVVAASADPTASTARLRRPEAILRYLDVAVVVELMRELGLTEELAQLLPKENSDVSAERIVTALVAQRCLAPQSKLSAVRWFPRTALPELLGVGPSQFNNIRVVVYFNPEIFARQRWQARKTEAEIQNYLSELNERLARQRSRIKPATAVRLLEERLRHHDLLRVFEVTLESEDGGEGAQLLLTRDDAQWQRRRNFDGFSVLVASPDMKRSAAELCRTYRAKNVIEADFQVIKSLVKLRPVRHRTDVKVRAHVALCMLALYVQRELTARLKKGASAELCFEQLQPCQLSLYAAKGVSGDAYVLPKIDRETMGLLRRLKLTRLVDQRELGAALSPRSEFVSTEMPETA